MKERNRLAAIILDGLDPQNLRRLPMPFLQQLYGSETGGVLGCSSLPHTFYSNACIWSGRQFPGMYWASSGGSPRDPPEIDEGAGEGLEVTSREDFETAFIWDVLDHHGHDARAVNLPLTLPPFSYGTSVEEGDWWFPSGPAEIMRHVERAPSRLGEEAGEEPDFLAGSLGVPDKWLHMLSKGEMGVAEVEDQAGVFDRELEKLVETLEDHGFDWMLFGDHGSPRGGRTRLGGTAAVERHGKEALLVSSVEGRPPAYTSEIYPFLLDRFDAGDVPFERIEPEKSGRPDPGAVMEKLDRLGYGGGL